MSLSTFISSSRNIMRGDAGVDGDAQRIAQLTWMLFLKVYDAKEANWEIMIDDYEPIIPERLRWRRWAPDHKDGRSMTGDELLTFLNEDLFPTLKTLPITENTPLSQTIVKGVFEDSNQYMKDGILIRQLVNLINEINFDDYADRHAFGEIYETLLKELQSAGSSGEYYTPRAVTDFMIKMLNPKLGERVADFSAGTSGFLTSALKHLDPQVESVEDREKFQNAVFGIEKKPMPYLLGVTNLLLHDVDEPAFFHGNSLSRNVREYKEHEKFKVIAMNPPYGGTEQEAVKANFPQAFRSSETADLFVALITYRLKKNGRAGVVLPDGFLFGSDGAKLALKERLIKEFNLHTIIRLPGSVFSPYTSIATNLLFFDKTHPTKDVWFYRVDKPEGYKNFSKTKPLLLEHLQPAMDWWGSRDEISDADGNPKAKRYSAQEIIEGGYNLDLCGFPQASIKVLSPAETIANYKTRRAELDAQIDAQIALIESFLAVKE
ncbi:MULTISPECIES: HsdM family class I SAM-dependent methyltransferase [Corynebacterium]|uniref:class I SAM-dependent DNA methyltransferase n=1 Tax=Corynebacterium TaxID=1716 RepID=UPI0008A366CD|nr:MULTISPECIES: class I SAM-dependent DNA methyltransferase [Corynebacterium]MDK7198871.1 class I SAM-dependent DNA methyltransferase [Corynebacterium amycolatum]OFM54062.1 restriction endonuclease subunit M [Corynebacterium sp. HMSC064H12]OFQ03068.1 restriction endonuclease subunit M [Corynebacterium sp. HMSC070B05]